MDAFDAHVAAVLAGQRSYDELDELAQSFVRRVWDERIASALDQLNLEAEFRETRQLWAELDEHGDVIVRSTP